MWLFFVCLIIIIWFFSSYGKSNARENTREDIPYVEPSLSSYEINLMKNVYIQRFDVYQNLKRIPDMEMALQGMLVELAIQKKFFEKECSITLIPKHFENLTETEIKEKKMEALHKLVKVFKVFDYKGDNMSKFAASVWLITVNDKIPLEEKIQMWGKFNIPAILTDDTFVEMLLNERHSDGYYESVTTISNKSDITSLPNDVISFLKNS